MADFDLGVSFDAVVCLFSSIGYVGQVERLEKTLACFRRHLNPGAPLVVEPWFTPDAWSPGKVYVHSHEEEGVRVVRMSHSTVVGTLSKLDFHYLVGSEAGIEHRRESHELALFTKDEMLSAFEQAGFADVDYEPEGLTGRGLYVARAS